jgi:hypothetical protein
MLPHNKSFSLLVDILDNGELDKTFPLFLGATAEATLGEKFGLLGKSVPLRVVEGLTSFGVVFSFPMVRNKQKQQIDDNKLSYQ